MASKPAKITRSQDFSYVTDAELNAQIAAFAAAHEAEHLEILAMDAKRSLGPGKARITFRVVARPGKKR
jgi:ribulose bisphosphate carboxylase small subunit